MGQLAGQNLAVQPGPLSGFIQQPGLALLARFPNLFPDPLEILFA
jgi:hypothetical protein